MKMASYYHLPPAPLVANLAKLGTRVAKCRGYDKYIRVKIFAGWGKKSGRTGILAKLSLSWEGFAQLM